MGHPLDEFVLSDISVLPRLRCDFGPFEPPRQQDRPRTVTVSNVPDSKTGIFSDIVPSALRPTFDLTIRRPVQGKKKGSPIMQA